jgi:hypothetical protein
LVFGVSLHSELVVTLGLLGLLAFEAWSNVLIGLVESWAFGLIALWPFGPLALWPFGLTALWPYSPLAL